MNYALTQMWQVLTKGSGGHRPGAFARQIAPDDWHSLRPNDRWVTQVVDPPSYVKPVQNLLLRWSTQKGQLKHATLVCSILAWSMPQVVHWMFASGPLSQFGPTRLIEDALTMPGHLIFAGDHLVEVQLNERHPHATQVAESLERLLAHFGHP